MLFVFGREQHMRTEGLKTYQPFRALKGREGYPQVTIDSTEAYRSWLAKCVGSNLAEIFSAQVVGLV